MLELEQAASIQVGRLGRFDFTAGWYLYVGSAFGSGGVQARCQHHLRISPRPHWHVDYLRLQCRVREIWFSHDPKHREHEWASILKRLQAARLPVPAFGSSDCDCPSHLFYFDNKPQWHEFERMAAGRLAGQKVIFCETF